MSLILPLLLLIGSLTMGQQYEYVPFPTENAIWSEIYYPGGVDEKPILERFALNGEDTTINNLVYKKLFLFYDTVFNVNTATYFGGIREDSIKRVYFKGDIDLHEFKPNNYHNREIVLFDFSVEVGDSLGYYKDSQDFNCEYWDILIVNKIDTVSLGGKLRKRIQFEDYFWVEWIGNLRGLLFNSGDLPFNGLYGDLVCFKQNDEIAYLNGTECMPLITNIHNNGREIKKLNIFPNPATDNISIFFQSAETGYLLVIDENGKTVYKTQLINVEEEHLTLPCLNSGLYHIVFINKKNELYSSQLILN